MITALNFSAPTISLLGSLRQSFRQRFNAMWDDAPLTRAQESAQVREMARGLQVSDHGFAADLYAAADRHDSRG